MERRLAAILSADVVGYSRLIEQDETSTLAALKQRHQDILAALIDIHAGRIVKIMGDGVLVEFGSAVKAVTCAVELQKQMTAANEGLPEDRRIILRVGINLGDVIVEDGDLYGEGVIIAVRLQAIAAPGGICISASVHHQIENRSSHVFEDLGLCEIKNSVKPLRVFQLRIDAQTGPSASWKPAASKPSVAVLPFKNMSGDREQQYFSDGITEDIITELSRFRELAVMGRTSSFAYRDEGMDLQTIARELSVQYLVDGSVRKRGDRLRITAQLITAATGAQVWAERYDRGIEGIFDVQDEITETIVATLSGQIKTVTMEQAKRRPPSSWRAYDWFLMGMEGYYSPRTRENTKQVLNRTIRSLQKAIEIDPQYARAYGKLGGCYTLLANYTIGDQEVRARAMGSAREYAEKAVSLDRSDADALLALGYVFLWSGSSAEGEHVLERACAVNPHDIDITTGYVTALSYIGKAEQAVALAEAAIRRNPRQADNDLFDLAVAHFFDRHPDQAVTLFDRLSEIFEDREIIAAAYAHAGRLDEACRHAALHVDWLRTNWIGNPTSDVSDYLRWDFEYNCLYKRPEDVAYVCEGLRKAGLPI